MKKQSPHDESTNLAESRFSQTVPVAASPSSAAANVKEEFDSLDGAAVGADAALDDVMPRRFASGSFHRKDLAAKRHEYPLLALGATPGNAALLKAGLEVLA